MVVVDAIVLLYAVNGASPHHRVAKGWVDVALNVVEAWLSARAATVAQPTARHAAVLGGFLRASGTAGNLVTDAHLAALAIEYGARLCTFDRDFARFAGVRSFAPA